MVEESCMHQIMLLSKVACCPTCMHIHSLATSSGYANLQGAQFSRLKTLPQKNVKMCSLKFWCYTVVYIYLRVDVCKFVTPLLVNILSAVLFIFNKHPAFPMA